LIEKKGLAGIDTRPPQNSPRKRNKTNHTSISTTQAFPFTNFLGARLRSFLNLSPSSKSTMRKKSILKQAGVEEKKRRNKKQKLLTNQFSEFFVTGKRMVCGRMT
jgi:hypothetical protein